MLVLFFFVFLIQFFTYWIFEPLTSSISHILEIRLFPVIAIAVLILMFSAKNIEHY